MRISALLSVSITILVSLPLSTHAQQTTAPNEIAAQRTKSCGESFPRNSTEEFNRKCIALAGPLAAMRGEVIVIRLDNGSRKIFDNKNSEGAAAGAFGYGLADFYPDTHIFVICDHGPDSGHCLAIDGRTGRQLDFGYAFPQFSPDGNWVLSIEYGGEDDTASFAILDVREPKSRTVWKSKTSKPRLPAKVDFVAWDDDKTIRLASAGRKPVLLMRADDGSWGLGTTPGH